MKIDKPYWLGEAEEIKSPSLKTTIDQLIDNSNAHETAIAELQLHDRRQVEWNESERQADVDFNKRIEALESRVKLHEEDIGVYVAPPLESGGKLPKWIAEQRGVTNVELESPPPSVTMMDTKKGILADYPAKPSPDTDKPEGSWVCQECGKDHGYNYGPKVARGKDEYTCLECDELAVKWISSPEPDKPEAPDQDIFDGIDTYVEEGRVICANCHQFVDGLLDEVCNGHWVCAKCGTTRTERDYPWRDKSKIYNCTRCYGVKTMRWLEAIPPEVTRLQIKIAELNTEFNEAAKEAEAPAPDELRPCPFCGEPDTALYPRGIEDQKHMIRCERCGAEGPTAQMSTGALIAWSTRPIEDKLLEIISKLRKRNWEAYLKQAMEEDKNGD